MTAMATEASTLIDGARVRITHVGVSNQRFLNQVGTYIADQSEPGSECCNGDHRLVIRLDDGDLVTVRDVVPIEQEVEQVTVAQVPVLAVGMRVTVANPAYCFDGSGNVQPRGWVSPDAYGRVGVVTEVRTTYDNVRVESVDGRRFSQVIAPQFLTPVVTEDAAPEPENREFAPGQRVRVSPAAVVRERLGAAGLGVSTWVNNNEGREVTLTSIAVGPGGRYPERTVWQIDGGGRQNSIYQGWIEHLPAEPARDPRSFVAGDRIVIASLDEIRGREHISGSSSSYANSRDAQTGLTGVLVSGNATDGEGRIWQVRMDNGTSGSVWQSHINRVDAGTTESPRRPGEIRPGDVVRVRRGQYAGSEGSVTSLTDSMAYVNLTYYGQRRLYQTALRVIAPTGVVATPTERPVTDGVNNPIALGTNIIVGRQRGVVVDKADDWFRQNYGVMYQRSADYVGYEYNYEGRTTKSVTDMRSVIEVPALGDLTLEQQLLRLQTLIHRVASYEAVRRDWCDEVNGALAPLDLPEHLATVDRDLGRALRNAPRELLRLDGPIQSARTPATPTVGQEMDDDDGTTPYDTTYNVLVHLDGYTAEQGFEVHDAEVWCVIRIQGDDDDYNPGDPSEFAWSEYLTDQEVLDAIRADGSLPNPHTTADLSWSEGDDWNEV